MRYNFSIITLLGVLFLLSSCSYGPFSQSTNHAKPIAKSDVDGVPCLAEQQGSESESKSESGSEAVAKYTPVDSSLMMADEPKAPEVEPTIVDTVATAMVYDHSFSKNETMHVKISNYNPFKNGKFRVDLDTEQPHYPINGKCISAYGMRGRRMHTGTDIKGTPKAEIRAVFAGVVRLSAYYGGYGNVIVVRHENGLETVYSHNFKNLVKVGQMVAQGEKIALCGRTGSASTEHLHLEFRVQGSVLNPSLIFDFTTQKPQPGQLIVTSTGGQIKATRQHNGKSAQSHTVKDNQVVIPPAGAVEASSSSQSKAVSTATKYHTVVKGDTLYGMALKYKTTVKNICALNNIKPTTILALGRKIRVK